MGKPKPVTVLEAKQRLHLFNEKAETLRRSNFKSKVFVENHGFTMTFGTQPTIAERRGADEDSTLALVTTLRFFVQPGDGISFKQMADLYDILPVPDEDRSHVNTAHEDVEAFLDSEVSGIAVVINGEKLTNRKFFETFMYGWFAHAKPDKRSYYEKWVKDSPMRCIMETIFEEIVAALLRVIFWFPPTNENAIQRLSSYEDSRILGHVPT